MAAFSRRRACGVAVPEELPDFWHSWQWPSYSDVQDWAQRGQQTLHTMSDVVVVATTDALADVSRSSYPDVQDWAHRGQQALHSISNAVIVTTKDVVSEVSRRFAERHDEAGDESITTSCAPVARCLHILAPQGTTLELKYAVVPTLLLLSASHGHMHSIMLCGINDVITTKTVFLSASAALGVATYSVWQRHSDDPLVTDRQVQRRAAIALGTCSAYYFLAASGMTGSLHASWFSHHFLAMRFLQDLVATPLLILNLGAITGAQKEDLTTGVFSAGASTACFMCAALSGTGTRQFMFLAVGCASSVIAAMELDALPEQAEIVGPLNPTRSRMAAELIMLGWAIVPAIEALGLLGFIPMNTQLNAFACVDVIFKIGVAHVLVRDKECLKAMQSHAFRRHVVGRQAAHHPMLQLGGALLGYV